MPIMLTGTSFDFETLGGFFGGLASLTVITSDVVVVVEVEEGVSSMGCWALRVWRVEVKVRMLGLREWEWVRRPGARRGLVRQRGVWGSMFVVVAL